MLRKNPEVCSGLFAAYQFTDGMNTNANLELSMEDLHQVIGGAGKYSDNKINGYTSKEAGSRRIGKDSR